MKRRISVRGIALHDGKLLCMRLKPHEGGITDYWCLPGGGLEEGEPLLVGVRREMVEETGIEPQIGALLYVQQFVEDEREFLEFFFHIINGQDYQHIDLSRTTHGEAEVAQVAFIDPAAEYVLPKFLGTDDIVALAERRGPVRVYNESADLASTRVL